MSKKGVGCILIAFLFTVGCAKSLSEQMEEKKEEVKKILAEEKFIAPDVPVSSFTARELIEEVITNFPDDCEANYLLLLTDLKNLIETLDPLIQVVQTLEYSSGMSPLSGGLVDSIVSGILLPLLEIFDEMDNAVSIIESQRCSVLLSKYPIKLGMDTSPLIDIYLAGYEPKTESPVAGEWDVVEAELIGSFVSLIKAGLHYLLSIDLDLDVESAMDAVNQGIIGFEDDIISIIRNLGFIPAQNPDFLKFHTDPERKNYYTMVGNDFATALRRFSNFLMELFNEQDEEPYNDVIAGIDEDHDGKVDRLQFNVFDGETNERRIIVEIEGSETDILALIEFFVSTFIDYEYIQNASQIINNIADAFDGINTDPVYISDFEPLLFNIIDFPDVIKFYPWKLYPDNIESAKPPKDLLPYWEDTNGDGFEEFIIEGEVPQKYAQSATDYIFVGDSSHFEGLTKVESIPKDCVYPDTLTLFYIAFQDPSFNGAIEINLSQIENEYNCSYSDYKNWGPATNFSLNVVINHTIKIVAPIIEQMIGSM